MLKVAKQGTPKKSKEQPTRKTPKKSPSREREDGGRSRSNHCLTKNLSQEILSGDRREKQQPSSQQSSRQQPSSQQHSKSETKEPPSKCKLKKTTPPPAPPPRPVQPRRVASFGQTKPVKTSKDIKEELQEARSKVVVKNLLVGVDGKEYDMMKEIYKGKKGSIVRVVDRRPEFAYELLAAKTKNVTKESIHNEIRFLLEFQQTLRDNWHGSDHFLPICSYGSAGDMAWFVQPLCGPNVDELRRETNDEFSPQTALRIGLMMLDAISCLHHCDVVHGRLEPQHVVIGAGTMKSCAYLVGLGHICQANPLPPTFTWSREPAYAPRRVARDPFATELETWFYLLLDLYGRSHLPWKRDSSFEKVQLFKEQIHMFPMLLPSHFPSLFHDLLYTLNKGDGYEGNMARILRRRVTDYMREEKISRHRPFEWEKTQKVNVNHVERMREYNKTASIIRSAAEKVLTGFVAQEDDD